MAITAIDIASGEEGALNLLVDCEVTNPSNVKPEMGEVTLELWTDTDYFLGTVTVEDFVLEANEDMNAVTSFSAVPAKFTLPTESDEAIAAGRLFLSNFVSGVDQVSNVKGSTDGTGTDLDLLKPALSALETTSVVPGLVGNIIVSSIMDIPNLLHPYDLPTVLTVSNPFSAPMKVTQAHNEIYPCKHWEDDDDSKCKEFFADSAGYYTPDELSVEVPAKSTVVMDTHPVLLNALLTVEMIETLFTSAGGGSIIRIQGTMDIEVGDFKTQVDFAETQIPICLRIPLVHTCSDFANAPPGTSNKELLRLANIKE
jgi:hypothetical protein